MAYRYYASVTFPASATSIPEVEAWLKDNQHVKVEEGQGLCEVSMHDASFGEIDITDVLDEHCVPYDHYHQDDIDVETWTVVVRFKHTKKVAHEEWKEDEVKTKFAKRLLRLLESGRTKMAITVCEKAAAPRFVDIAELATAWAPQASSTASAATKQAVHALS